MILTAHQPAYLPWLGYFEKLIRSDIFIFLDSVQFEKNSFINRNKIKTPQGELWLTVPVKMKGHMDKAIAEIEIDNTQNWRKKHLSAIMMNYKKAPFFEQLFPALEKFYTTEWPKLSDLCYEQLLFWLSVLKVEKKIVKSSTLPISAKKSDLIFELCTHFKADHYLSGAMGRDYLDEKKFSEAGIAIEYQSYIHPVYAQQWGEFIPFLGILDYCMNNADAALLIGNAGGA